MKKKIIGILDREEGYAARLMEVFNSRNRMGFQAEMFTGVNSFLEYSRKHPVEILLVGESLMERALEALAAMVIVISEGAKAAELEQYRIVYKYQSSEMIIRRVMEFYALEGKSPNQLYKGNVKLYGVYAPQGRGCNSCFAWNLAKQFSRDQSVLYISLTAFSDKKELYVPEKELADIMYYVRHGFDNLIYMVGSVVIGLEGIDCMPPVKSVEDLIHVPCEDWLKILQVISTQSNYEAVVVEVGECVQQFYRVLDYCTEIYMPFVPKFKNMAIWEVCKEYFKRMGAEDVWNRAKRLEVDGNYWRSDMSSIISS